MALADLLMPSSGTCRPIARDEKVGRARVGLEEDWRRARPHGRLPMQRSIYSLRAERVRTLSALRRRSTPSRSTMTRAGRFGLIPAPRLVFGDL